MVCVLQADFCYSTFDRSHVRLVHAMESNGSATGAVHGQLSWHTDTCQLCTSSVARRSERRDNRVESTHQLVLAVAVRIGPPVNAAVSIICSGIAAHDANTEQAHLQVTLHSHCGLTKGFITFQHPAVPAESSDVAFLTLCSSPPPARATILVSVITSEHGVLFSLSLVCSAYV